MAHTADWNLSLLMDELSRRSSGQAEFSETKYLAVLDEPIEQSGTLAFAPGRLEKFTQRPHAERMTVIGDDLTVEIGPERKKRKLRLHRYPALWGFIEGLRATLTGDLEALRRFYDIELHGSADDWELVLVPNRSEMSAVVRLVSIRGGFGRISIIEVVQESGDRSVMQISERDR
ncbi:MAG: outer membrane lipoprotein carrier protein LolA [Betaproteobacteria bacterium]|nr:MAG: outer membrane lipoprotein carrier protein LolA [Betaproteobacteria bacterium]